jgi:hypothetical protein
MEISYPAVGSSAHIPVLMGFPDRIPPLDLVGKAIVFNELGAATDAIFGSVLALPFPNLEPLSGY